jgi:hypothetical protein
MKLPKGSKLLLPLGLILLIAILVVPGYAGAPESPVAGRPPSLPVPAVDVEIVKKATLRGPKAPGGKPLKQAATGILGEPCTGDKFAIIIGISDYPGESSDLNYCDDDANDVKLALTTLYGYQESNILLLVDGDATRSAIISSILTVRGKATPDDEVFFFFSGHGARGKASDGDSEKVDEAIVCHEGGEFSYIWDGELKLFFSGFATTRIIFVFDSCLSGGMTDLNAAGRVIAMACSESGVSLEGEVWGNGQFTFYFFDQGMLAGKADVHNHNDNPKPDVVIEESFDYARANCVQQTPVISDSFMNDLLP